ncbi:MAG: CDP-diacylglycerol--serine O-phosphatidyltransferase [Myxococcota bacterium]|nr:CDP-diacylglycerol--serine O-phosphatidyltransferase [Myxococcota bacterium]
MKSRFRRRRRFDLSKALFILPNLFTVSAIFCGFYAAILAASANGAGKAETLYRACIAVLFAMVFDAVDGRVARLTKTQSAFGVQMDSLADVISFGIVPGLIAWHWGLNTLGTFGLFACFFFCACGAIRLARFNVMAAAEDGPSAYFLGLPIPAAAGFLVACIIATLKDTPMRTTLDWWPAPLLFLLGILMVSNVRFRTFKAARLNAKGALLLVGVVGSTLAVGVRFSASIAIVALMGGYLMAGVVEGMYTLFKRGHEATDAIARDQYEDDEEELID